MTVRKKAAPDTAFSCASCLKEAALRSLGLRQNNLFMREISARIAALLVPAPGITDNGLKR